MGRVVVQSRLAPHTDWLTHRPLAGNPIDCVHTKDIPEDVLNTYCWIHSTYTLKSLFKKKSGSEVPYPGVGNSEGKEIDRKVYKYYQWVCFCLFFQVSHGGFFFFCLFCLTAVSGVVGGMFSIRATLPPTPHSPQSTQSTSQPDSSPKHISIDRLISGQSGTVVGVGI